MAVQEPVDSYIEVDPEGKLSVASDIITATAWQTRQHLGYIYDDKGIGGIADGYSYRTYFEFSQFTATAVVPLIMTGNTVGDSYAAFLAAPDTALVWLQANRWYVWHFYGASQTESVNKAFPGGTPMLNNRYAMDLSRSGQSLIGDLYDIDGGHGTPGALIDTQTLNCAQTLEDHRYLSAVASFDDGVGAAAVSGTFELWNMIAVAGQDVLTGGGLGDNEVLVGGMGGMGMGGMQL